MIELIKKGKKYDEPEDELNVWDYIVPNKAINDTLSDFLEGNLMIGYKCGLNDVDKHLQMKRNELYTTTGKKGRGKTTITQAMQIMYTIPNPELIWVVAYQENSDWSMKWAYLNILLGEHVGSVKKNQPERYKKALDWIDAHFYFINVSDVKTALLITKTLIRKEGVNVFGLVLDPINSFDSGFESLGNGYENGVNTAKKVLKFSQDICSIFLSQHPTMSAQREARDMTSRDAEGGWYNNKASFTMSINREAGTNTNRLNIENVRNALTGGKPTDMENDIVIEWNSTSIDVGTEQGTIYKDFIGYLREKYNPLEEEIKQTEVIPIATPDEAFGSPF